MSYAAKVAKALEDGTVDSVSKELLNRGVFQVTARKDEHSAAGTGATDEEALAAALKALGGKASRRK